MENNKLNVHCGGLTDSQAALESLHIGSLVDETHSDECSLEVQQLRFGLRVIPVVTTQLKHPQDQHQRTVLRDTQNTKMLYLTSTILKKQNDK